MTLVGAGPGDPELITVRGREALETADVVVYDRLAAFGFLQSVRPEAELIDVGKSPARQPVPQDEINQLLVRKALAGKRVVRLKGGDPLLFGRGGEELEVLRNAGIPVQIVPGVTAASGAAAYCGMPLTHRGLSSCVTFVTGHEEAGKGREDVRWDVLARTGGTIVVYMGMERISGIAEALIKEGMPADTPVAVIHKATLPEQKSIRTILGKVAETVSRLGMGAPGVLVVGKVAGRNCEPWFERLPLFGCRLLVTRSQAQAGALAAELGRLGARVWVLPTISIEEPADPAALGKALRRLPEYEYVVFTSANAVEKTMSRLGLLGLDARSFHRARICAIGEATAGALARCGLKADVVAANYTAEGLLEALSSEPLAGKRVLLPRAAEAREALPDGLRAKGATVDVVDAYVTARPGGKNAAAARALEAVASAQLDLLTFTSSSTVKNFVAMLEADELQRALELPVAAIGPITAETAREKGFTVLVQPDRHTVPALVEAIVDYFSRRRHPAGSEESEG